MSDDFLRERRDSLVEEFFHKESIRKIAALRAKLGAQKTREELRRASSVTDEGLLEKLVEIGLTAETVAALSLVPLVHVAWADGKVQPEERDAILRAAEGKGVERGSPPFDLLTSWLEKGEPPDLYKTWSRYVGALLAKLTPEQGRVLRRQIMSFARSVAEAAGGFMGLKRVSHPEEQALEQIDAAFRDRSSR